MTIIAPGASTRNRYITVRVTLDRPLLAGQTLVLYRGASPLNITGSTVDNVVFNFLDNVTTDARSIALNYKVRFTPAQGTPTDSGVRSINIVDNLYCAIKCIKPGS